jgi:hypothetical protein
VREDAFDPICDGGFDVSGGESGERAREEIAGNAGAEIGEDGAGDIQEQSAIHARSERREAGLGEKLVHGRNLPQEFGLFRRKSAFCARFHAAI